MKNVRIISYLSPICTEVEVVDSQLSPPGPFLAHVLDNDVRLVQARVLRLHVLIQHLRIRLIFCQLFHFPVPFVEEVEAASLLRRKKIIKEVIW